ncbi:MAG: hypothetical protein RJQ14_27695, partial [Marinoscillum sp.]
MSAPRLLAAVLAVFIFSITTQAQTWEVMFKKAEKKYAKGKYHKVQKQIKKLRTKHINKKYSGDSSLYALTYVMEAKADHAMADYSGMRTAIDQALPMLEQYKVGHQYSYTMGLLRLVDLYNDYGNHKKADSIASIADALSPEYLQSDILQMEIQMRRAFTNIELGYYNKTAKTINELSSTWPSKLKLSYALEPVEKVDEAYKKQLLVQMYTAEGEIQRRKGEYEKAVAVFENHSKQVNRLVDGTSQAYVEYRIAEARTYLDWGNTDESRKISGRITNLNPPGRLYEKAANIDILSCLEEEKYSDALSTSMQLESTLIKSRVDRDYA